ncbi:MAG: thiamine ABC transporter, substrate-binding component [Anaerolineae bacterium]|jgi:thiamine transport system substrate-binding protein|nr:MAG: thiamine ABC transporter, substrate-binding component [Anaerolineae bacterium]
MIQKTYFSLEKWAVILLGISLLATACSTPTATPTPTENPLLTVMTHDSFAATETVIAAFETEHQVKVQFLKAGDVGSALNKAILAKGNPLADVFYGVDNTFFSRAIAEDLFEPYASPLLTEIPTTFRLDAQNRLLPVDYGDVCLNYDRNFFTEKGIQPPQNLDDLIKPEYKSLLVVQNPALSSPGLAFLLTTIGVYGTDGYLDYWKKLVENDVKVVNDWESAYYSEFSVHGGTRPIVVSYSSSPPAEVIFAETPIDEPPTGVVTEGRSCFRQIEFVGILKGAKNRPMAEKWVDFMLSKTFQEDMPLQMFVFPVNPNAQLPDEFTRFVVIPSETAQVDPQAIEQNREAWIQAWSEAVLR